ncbi:ubiquitin-protein ligase molybdopterin-converting factor [Cystobasidium minutum MCA 4210]|uniref:ubiquitin-protein ligase molybdopterin-converting factor n=1 Tax=Cystobasidium minutum MCA 4210 TaxID=1397322 RepID=UPI0034CDFFA9|eukprot:jgi/Rhomi1/145111/e_gw1.5.994.1
MAISDTLSNLYSRFQIFSKTQSARFIFAITASSIVTTLSLLTFQSFQRRTYRKALRDNIETRLASLHERDEQASNGRPSISRKTTIDNIDEELIDYSNLENATQRKKRDRHAVNGVGPTASTTGANTPSGRGNDDESERVYDEEIINEQLARNIAFLGEEAVEKIRNSFVVVVGMGGVGSAAATMLARSGVGKIRIIDFDQVSLSSLNRHTVATLADVGTSKVQCCKAHFKRIVPWVHIDAQNELFSLESADRLLSGSPDYVLDCIDNISTKVDLLAYCVKNGLKVFSAMGAGGKYDPTRVQISDISETFEDPLARSVRVRLKKAGVSSGVPVVYSTERPSTLGRLMPLPEEEFQKGAVHELSALEAFRVRILPVLGPLPCMFGQAAAAYIIAMLAGNVPMQPLAVKNRHKIYRRLHNDLAAREERLTGINKIPFSEEEFGFIFEELHRGRSVIAPTFAVPARPSASRWRKDEPVTWENIVIFDKDEAMKHEKEVLLGGKKPEEVWNEETVRLVERRRQLAKDTQDFRLL